MQEIEVPNGGGEASVAIGKDWGAGAYVTAMLYRPLDESLKRMPSRAIGVQYLQLDQSARTLKVALDTPEKIKSHTTLTVPVKITGLEAGGIVVIRFSTEQLRRCRHRRPCCHRSTRRSPSCHRPRWTSCHRCSRRRRRRPCSRRAGRCRRSRRWRFHRSRCWSCWRLRRLPQRCRRRRSRRWRLPSHFELTRCSGPPLRPGMRTHELSRSQAERPEDSPMPSEPRRHWLQTRRVLQAATVFLRTLACSFRALKWALRAGHPSRPAG